MFRRTVLFCISAGLTACGVLERALISEQRLQQTENGSSVLPTPPPQETSNSGPTPSPTPASTPMATACKAVRYYTYTLNSTQALLCDSPATTFSITVPDKGRALMRVTYQIQGTGSGSEGVHGWSSQMMIGDLGFPDMINFGVGEDACPSETLTKRFMGYGNFTATNSKIVISTQQYRSNACQNGVIQIMPNSKVEVWVEDDAPNCVGKDIRAVSYFGTVWAASGVGANQPVGMTTNVTQMLSTSFNLPSTANVLVMGQSEISPSSTSNSCGNRVQTAASFVGVNGSYVGSETAGYPASGGMTHVLLSPEYRLTNAAPQNFTFSIASAVNQTAQVGAVAGHTSSGDTILGIVFQR